MIVWVTLVECFEVQVHLSVLVECFNLLNERLTIQILHVQYTHTQFMENRTHFHVQ